MPDKKEKELNLGTELEKALPPKVRYRFYAWLNRFKAKKPKTPDTENNPSAAKQLIETYYETGGSVMAGIKAKSDADYSKYGFAAGNLVKPGLIS